MTVVFPAIHFTRQYVRHPPPGETRALEAPGGKATSTAASSLTVADLPEPLRCALRVSSILFLHDREGRPAAFFVARRVRSTEMSSGRTPAGVPLIGPTAPRLRL